MARRKIQQIERMKRALGRIDIDLLDQHLGILRKLLDDAQNPPPEGAADGSVDEEAYTAVRAVAMHLSSFIVVATKAKSAVRHRTEALRSPHHRERHA